MCDLINDLDFDEACEQRGSDLPGTPISKKSADAVARPLTAMEYPERGTRSVRLATTSQTRLTVRIGVDTVEITRSAKHLKSLACPSDSRF